MSVIASLRRQVVPVHSEGYVFIAGFFVGALVLDWLWSPLGWLGFIATAWCIYFFRDPEARDAHARGPGDLARRRRRVVRSGFSCRRPNSV